MKIVKLTTKDINDVKPFLNGYEKYISEEEGFIEVIVGYDLAKEKGASILKHHLSDDRYWTFLPREKRDLFKEHIGTFIEEGYQKLIDGIEVENLDPIEHQTPESYLKSIEEVIRGCKGYLYSDRLYVYSEKLFHIDMGLLDFMSWDIKKDVVDMIDNVDVDIDNHKDDLKYIDKKYIPYLIHAEENNISSDFSK